MGILKRLRLKIWGNYCYYTIKPRTAIIVGVRHKNGQSREIPKRIGIYTVRGIHEITKLPWYWDVFHQLSDKQKDALVKKLRGFRQPVFGSLDQLPKTVEFVGYHYDVSGQTKSIPSHIRYIDTFVAGGTSLILPADLLYLGRIKQVYSKQLRCLNYDTSNPAGEPYLPASCYLGAEVENVPQMADGALAECASLDTFYVSPRLQKIGAHLFGDKIISVNIGTFPRNLRSVEGDSLACCRMEVLQYPGDIHEDLRSRALRLRSINRLIVDDMTGLEEYTALVRQGNAPERHLGACLYHLLRAAKSVQINVQVDRIFDGMFQDCTQLSSLRFHERPSQDTVWLDGGITAIGAEAFRNCNAITTFLTHQLIQSVGDRAFMSSGITAFTVYGLVKYVGREAFCQCSSLQRLNIHAKNVEIGEDAFVGCDKLEISPEDRNRIAHMPCFPSYLAIEQKRTAKVTEMLRRGDGYLRQKPVTLDAKKSAFNAYWMALQYDHYRMEIMNKITMLLLDDHVPFRIDSSRLATIRSSLKSRGSDAMLASLNSALQSVDDMSVILCACGDICSVARAFALNGNPEAAVILCEYFAGTLGRHSQASIFARGNLCAIMNELLNRGNGKDLHQRIAQLKDRLAVLRLGTFIEQEFIMTLMAEGALERHLTAEYFQTLYDGAVRQGTLTDAEMWADLLRQFAPGKAAPKEHIKMKKKTAPAPTSAPKATKAPKPQSTIIQPINWTVPETRYTVPYVPPMPTSEPVRYIGDETEEEFNRRTSELLSEYHAEQEAKRIAKEIEDSMFSPPGTYGGY